jgi:hypothetical protein
VVAKEQQMAFTTAIFLIDRAYGGPEEGGWYYDTGEPSDEHANHTRGFDNQIDACAYARELDSFIFTSGMNKGRREISSVLSTGRYAAIVQEGQPKSYPDERPYYE